MRTRPTVLTDALVTIAVEARKRGLSVEKCAAKIGVTRQAIVLWLSKGEAHVPGPDDGVYVDFAVRFREAEAERQETLLGKAEIEKNGSGVRLLEITFPNEFGTRSTTVHEVGTDANTQDATARLLALINRHAPAEGAREGSSEPQPE